MSFEALMLAAGKGRRLGPKTVSKPMLDVAGAKLYEFAWSIFEELGCKKVRVVAGENSDLVRHITRTTKIPVEFVLGAGPTIPDSIRKCLPFQSDVVMMFADEYISRMGARKAKWHFLKGWNGEPPDAVLGAVRLDSDDRAAMKRTYALSIKGGYEVTRLREKPKRVSGDYMGTGFAIASADLLNAAAPRVRTANWVDLWNEAIAMGYGIRLHPLPKPYFNVNTKTDLKALWMWVSEQ